MIDDSGYHAYVGNQPDLSWVSGGEMESEIEKDLLPVLSQCDVATTFQNDLVYKEGCSVLCYRHSV